MTAPHGFHLLDAHGASNLESQVDMSALSGVATLHRPEELYLRLASMLELTYEPLRALLRLLSRDRLTEGEGYIVGPRNLAVVLSVCVCDLVVFLSFGMLRDSW